jgi:hypothetical protein
LIHYASKDDAYHTSMHQEEALKDITNMLQLISSGFSHDIMGISYAKGFLSSLSQES